MKVTMLEQMLPSEAPHDVRDGALVDAVLLGKITLVDGAGRSGRADSDNICIGEDCQTRGYTGAAGPTAQVWSAALGLHIGKIIPLGALEEMTESWQSNAVDLIGADAVISDAPRGIADMTNIKAVQRCAVAPGISQSMGLESLPSDVDRPVPVAVDGTSPQPAESQIRASGGQGAILIDPLPEAIFRWALRPRLADGHTRLIAVTSSSGLERNDEECLLTDGTDDGNLSAGTLQGHHDLPSRYRGVRPRVVQPTSGLSRVNYTTYQISGVA